MDTTPPIDKFHNIQPTYLHLIDIQPISNASLIATPSVYAQNIVDIRPTCLYTTAH
jgi:hypothetical protein